MSSLEFVEGHKDILGEHGLNFQYYEAYARTYDNLRQAIAQWRYQDNGHASNGMPSDPELAQYFETVFFRSIDTRAYHRDNSTENSEAQAMTLLVDCMKAKLAEYILMIDAPIHTAFNDIMYF